MGWGWKKGEPETFAGNFDSHGIHNVALANAIGDAIDFQLSIGREEIEARGREIAEYGKDVFTRIPGARLLTPRDPALCGSMASYALPPLEDGERMLNALRSRNLFIPAGANSAGGRMRVSTHIYNGFEDVDLLAGALRESYGF